MRGARVLRTYTARKLRRNSTDAELCLWNRLRARAIGGFKFVRQEPIGPFVVDFVCRDRLLVVEVDGGQHAESALDAQRDRWLKEQGYRVLRFWNNDVMNNISGVLEVIFGALHSDSPPHPARNTTSKTRVNALGARRPLPASGER